MDFYERQGQLYDEAVSIFDLIENEGRDATDKEIAELEDLAKKYEGSRNVTELKEVVDRYKENPYGDRITDSNSSVMSGSKKSNGFKNLGDFALSIYNSHRPGNSRIDPRLIKNQPSTTSTEGVGADGGYLVAPDYRREILDAIVGEDSILNLTKPIITNSNQIVAPADETTPWQTDGGVQVYWESEAGQKTQSKVALKEKIVKLNKLICLVPVSDELLQDAPSLDSYLRRTVAEKMNFAVNLALVQGSGAGEPQGVLNCPSLVSVAGESGQSADTVVL